VVFLFLFCNIFAILKRVSLCSSKGSQILSHCNALSNHVPISNTNSPFSTASGAFDASKSFEFLEFALSRGSHVDCGLGGVEGQRAINTAIEYHRIEILDWFIQKGASLNVKDRSGSYPLHYLIRSGFSGMYPVKKLLEAGADPNAREGDTAPLHLAIINNRLEDVSQLLEGGADPTLLCNGGDGDLVSALHYAVKMGNLEIVSLLVKRQTSEAMSPSTESLKASQRIELLEQLDGHGNTPLLTASQRGNVEIVNFLLEAGAETSSVNDSGFLCIHCAAIGRHNALLHVLAQQMDVNSKTSGGSTALHIVSYALREDTDAASQCCSALIQAGADPTLQDSNGNTSLSFIAANLAGNDNDQLHQIRRSLLDLMVEKHINLNFPSAGSCMIHQAIENHDAIFVQDLLERGVSVDALDNVGWPPLRRCVNMGQGTSFKKPGVILANICDIATNLIANGADIYRVDSQGLSLLVYAVLSGNAPMVHLLLEYFEQGISRQPARPGNTLKPLIETRPPSTASIPSTKTSKRASLIGKFKQVVKPKEAPVPEESRLKSKKMAEERFRRIGSIDREIIITAWHTAVLQARWDCVSAFIDRNLHGGTDSVKHPIGLGLLRYALEEEIGSVLMAFMGSHRHLVSDILVEARNPDPVLLDIWMRVCNRTEKQRGKDLGEYSIKRCAHLVENNGFTPFLDFPSLLEKSYIEAQSGGDFSERLYDESHDSLKEVYGTDKDEPTEAPVIALFNEEDDDDDDHFDEEVQMQLNSLIPKMYGWRNWDE
jgi:ankyrin repeat protein